MTEIFQTLAVISCFCTTSLPLRGQRARGLPDEVALDLGGGVVDGVTGHVQRVAALSGRGVIESARGRRQVLEIVIHIGQRLCPAELSGWADRRLPERSLDFSSEARFAEPRPMESLWHGPLDQARDSFTGREFLLDQNRQVMQGFFEGPGIGSPGLAFFHLTSEEKRDRPDPCNNFAFD